mmetsp:Transcript_37843/g.75861  ORF Transcript_37843/g.75861 Transcript_37843/m.75861 type:complete len:89 (+) Transcript_37843:1305-1571(+)
MLAHPPWLRDQLHLASCVPVDLTSHPARHNPAQACVARLALWQRGSFEALTARYVDNSAAKNAQPKPKPKPKEPPASQAPKPNAPPVS